MRPDVLGMVFVMAGAAGTAPLLPELSAERARPAAVAQPAADEVPATFISDPDTTDGMPPTTIRDLETITGTNDGHPLVGRRVEVYATVQGHLNPGVFWTGSADNRVLVVFARDETYDPALPVGSAAIVSGSVRRVADAREVDAWGLTPADRAELNARPIYLRADTVRPVLAAPESE